MRVLFTFTGGGGHLLPLLPFARAARARGHVVAVSGQEAMAASVERAGFAFRPSGGATLAAPASRGALLPVDRAHEERVLRDAFAGRLAAERAGRLLEVVREWRPDLMVRDEVDLGAAVAAERCGLPHAPVVVLAAGGFLRPDVVGAPLDALRAAHGLPADPALRRLDGSLVLVPVPPSFRDPRHPAPSSAVHVRPAVLEDEVEPSPAVRWLDGRARRPTAYVTLGTVFPQESGDLLRRVVTALADLDVDVVVTTGPALSPDELGPQPASVRVERVVPQAALLPRCDVVVCHAGSGSVVGALALGVPLVLLPLGADQPLNADRCAALRVGRVLDAVTADPDEVQEAVLDVLRTPGYRAAAGRLRDEARRLPTADSAVDLLEALARDGRAPA